MCRYCGDNVAAVGAFGRTDGVRISISSVRFVTAEYGTADYGTPSLCREALMTRILLVYWQQLTQRLDADTARSDAPVLELAACFGNPVIAARRARAAVHLADTGAAWPEPR